MRNLLAYLLMGVAAVSGYSALTGYNPLTNTVPPVVIPCPPDKPCPIPSPPKPSPSPWGPRDDGAVASLKRPLIQAPVIDGPSYQGLEVMTDLPVGLRLKNVGGRDGAGLCVFTSITHSARYQNEKKLWNFQQDMRKELGGGYPSKVDKMIEKYGKGAHYLQYEGNDPAILELAFKTGRMPAITYNGHDPHYGMNRSVSHMTNLVYLDDKYAAVLDNNFIGDNELVWLTRDEFLQRWRGGDRNAWCVLLLSNSPPPIPTK